MHLQAECWCPETWPSWANIWGVGRSISQLLIGPHAPSFVWRFLRHIGTFLDPLKGVDTQWAEHWHPKTRSNWANIWGVGRSISQLLIGPHAPNFVWKFLRHIGTFLDNMGGVNTPVGKVPVPKTGLNWVNTWGRGRSISQLLIGPHTPNFFRSS